MFARAAAAAALGIFPAAGLAQPAALSTPDAGQAPAPPAPASLDGIASGEPLVAPLEVKLPALSSVSLRVLDEISSKTAITGTPVRLALARPLYVSAGLGLPAGTPVEGVVIHAAKGGMGGKSGELLLGAKRILLSDSLSIPLRSFRLGPAKGQNNEGVAFGAAVAGGAVGAVASMFIVGGSARVAAGTEANARTSSDAAIPVALLSKLPPMPVIVVAPPPAAAAAVQIQSNPGGIK